MVSDAKVVGSDISLEALEVARMARYGAWSFRERPPERIPGLRQVGRQWEMVPRYRALVSFQEQNFADDPLLPPMSLPQRVDVIFCRNVLLYLKPARAAAVRRWLCESLAEGGLLLLGALEGPDQPPAGFSMRTEANACVLRRVASPVSVLAPPVRLTPSRLKISELGRQRERSARARVVERALEDARMLRIARSSTPRCCGSSPFQRSRTPCSSPPPSTRSGASWRGRRCSCARCSYSAPGSFPPTYTWRSSPRARATWAGLRTTATRCCACWRRCGRTTRWGSPG